jgi:hypothetical protein
MSLKTSISDSLLCSRGPSKGLIIIFDMHNTGIKHLMRTKVETLRVFFRYLQEALPAKLEAMHIINCVSFFDMVMAMIKPFMKSEIISKVRGSFNHFELVLLTYDLESITDAFTSWERLQELSKLRPEGLLTFKLWR